MAQLYSTTEAFLQKYTSYHHPLVLYLQSAPGAECDGFCSDELQNVYWDADAQHYFLADDWGGDVSFASYAELMLAINAMGLIVEARLKDSGKSTVEWDLNRERPLTK